MVKRLKRKWRVIEKGSGRIARNENGNPRDGGGFDSRARAEAQARAINHAYAEKKED